jgi:hypothetical protein
MSPMSPRLLRPRATGFSPRSISGLALWLDAADSATITTATGVSVWADKSGNGRNATQTTGGKQPIRTNTINGKSVITFQGTDDTMSIANVADFNATSQTVIVVARQTTAANHGLFYKASATVTNGVIMRYRTGSTIWLYQKNDNTAEVLSNNSNTNTNTNVYTAVLQPSAQAGFVNGSAPTNGFATNTVATAYDDTGVIWIGSRRDISEYLVGDVCEILHWPRALSTAERLRVERYLGGKWGITVA